MALLAVVLFFLLLVLVVAVTVLWWRQKRESANERFLSPDGHEDDTENEDCVATGTHKRRNGAPIRPGLFEPELIPRPTINIRLLQGGRSPRPLLDDDGEWDTVNLTQDPPAKKRGDA